MGVNLRAPFLLSQLFAKQMVNTETAGSIVNISSGAARKMRTTVVPYCTSKTALDRLTKASHLNSRNMAFASMRSNPALQLEVT